MILLALLAGIVTIAAPCTLPVLPALLGASIGRTDNLRPAFIVAGFVASFAAAAILFNVVTQIAGIDQTTLRMLAALLLAIFGVLMLRPHAFERLWVKLGSRLVPGEHFATKVADSNLSAFVLGTTLGLVWTPCSGPVLASILTLIATAHNLASGAVLLSAYAIGAAVPLFAIAWGGQLVTTRLKAVTRYAHRLQQGFGAAMIAFAAATYFDYDAQLTAWLSRLYPGSQIGL